MSLVQAKPTDCEEEVELTQHEIDYLRETMESILFCHKKPDGGYSTIDDDEVNLLHGLVEKLI